MITPATTSSPPTTNAFCSIGVEKYAARCVSAYVSCRTYSATTASTTQRPRRRRVDDIRGEFNCSTSRWGVNLAPDEDVMAVNIEVDRSVAIRAVNANLPALQGVDRFGV